MKTYHRYLPVIFLFALMVTVYFSGAVEYFSFQQIKQYRSNLLHYVHEHAIKAPIFFVLLYIFAASLALPICVYLSLLGGFLFTQPFSTVYVVVGATIGSSIIFLATQTAFRELFKKWAGPFLKKFESGLHHQAVSYLLFVRFVPIFPFWGINISAALLGINFLTFAWTTAVGMIPVSFIFTEIGAGLGAVFDQNQEFHLLSLFSGELMIALAGLGILALLPLLKGLSRV